MTSDHPCSAQLKASVTCHVAEECIIRFANPLHYTTHLCSIFHFWRKLLSMLELQPFNHLKNFMDASHLVWVTGKLIDVVLLNTSYFYIYLKPNRGGAPNWDQLKCMWIINNICISMTHQCEQWLVYVRNHLRKWGEVCLL